MPSRSMPELATTSSADLALVRAIRAFGTTGRKIESGSPTDILEKFSLETRERILGVWLSISRLTPEIAWQTLLRDQQASSRFDPARVHHSWLIRILAAESPAVRALVNARATGPIREALDRERIAPEITGRELKPANPEAAHWAMTLWSERLVGDVAQSPSDPPVILALSQFSFLDQLRFVRAIGQAKLAFAMKGMTPDSSIEAKTRILDTDRVRVAYFRRLIGEADPRLVPMAREEFETIEADRRRKFAALGLLTVARLLEMCDPLRVRWATQHLPYPIAKQLGKLARKRNRGPTKLPSRAVNAWETWIMEAAWARLLSEGRFGLGSGRKQL